MLGTANSPYGFGNDDIEPMPPIKTIPKEQFEWTDDKVKALMDYWALGLSASQIGFALRTTRNAILGKAHRLNLSKRKNGSNGRLFKCR